jgi:predicted secreted protein
MPTAGDHLGNLRLLYIDDVAVGCTTTLSASFSSESVDATCKDNDGARQSLPGQQNASVAVAGYQVFDQTVSIEDILALWQDRTEFECKLSTNVSGDIEIIGNAYFESVEISDNVNEASSWSGNIIFTGAVTFSAVPA